MKTIRRLYFYVVAFISVEVILWGLIALLRETIASGILPDAGLLSQGLAGVIVGLPFFLIHWLAAQRFALRDEDERESTLRAVFLFGILLATGIPAVQNVLALVDRLLLVIFGLNPGIAVVGGMQNWADNLIALAMNLGAGYYFYRVLRADLASLADGGNFDGVGRLARYVWVVYGLGMLVFGLQQVLYFVLTPIPSAMPVNVIQRPFVNGLALILVGTPLWLYFWRAAQLRLTDAAEARSTLRLGVLFLLALGAAGVTLANAGALLQTLIGLALGASISLADLFADVSSPLALLIPFALVWAYHGTWVRHAWQTYPEEPRRPGIRRLYYYLFALIGLGALTGGTAAMSSLLMEMLFGRSWLWSNARGDLAGALSAILIGLPLWLLTWRTMQADALAAEAVSARRSLVRRSYLYFALFAGVIGVMVSAVTLVYQLIVALLYPQAFSVYVALDVASMLVIFAVLLWYHLLWLRRDAPHADAAPADRLAAFPVLVLDSGNADWLAAVQAALRREAPGLPVTVRKAGRPGKADAAAVLLPAGLAADPPEALRRWLQDFPGQRVVVPDQAAGWHWPPDPRRAAGLLRALAQGDTPRAGTGVSAWQIVVYIFAGLFGLELLLLLITLFVNAL